MKRLLFESSKCCHTKHYICVRQVFFLFLKAYLFFNIITVFFLRCILYFLFGIYLFYVKFIFSTLYLSFLRHICLLYIVRVEALHTFYPIGPWEETTQLTSPWEETTQLNSDDISFFLLLYLLFESISSWFYVRIWTVLDSEDRRPRLLIHITFVGLGP